MNDKIRETKEWIYLADHDLGSAKIIFQYLPLYYEMIAFHCQQSVEKYIKGLLIYFEKDFKRTHDLVFLLDLLAEKIEVSPELYEKALSMEGFGVEIRYPKHNINMTTEELMYSIKIAEDYRTMVKKNVNFNIDENDLA